MILDFDPLLRLGELAVRWQTIGVTLALLAALGLAALLAPEVSARQPSLRRGSQGLETRFPDAPVIDTETGVLATRPPRLDDLVLIVGGIVPGAVIGGRLVHALVFWDAYAASPVRILDPSVGTLSLLGAVLGGLLSGAYVCRLIGAPARRWADAAAVPLLLAIGLGKAAQLLGGSGQGLPFEGPWSVAFGGPGPWISANPDLPSHAAQLYEGLWALIGIPIVLKLSGPRRKPVRVRHSVSWSDRTAAAGRMFVLALAWFLIGRLLIGFTWRDDPLLGALNGEQLLALAMLAAIAVGGALWYPRYRGRMQPRAEERAP